MRMLPRLLMSAARRIAADPRIRAKAAEVMQTEITPRAEASWRQAKPRLENAAAELRDIARETDPRANPRRFAAKVKQRFLDRDQSR